MSPDRPQEINPDRRRFHWATAGRTGVITCKGGATHVAVFREEDGLFRVFVLRNWGTEGRLIATCESWPDAKARAERRARNVGVDLLAFPGTWRSKPASQHQLRKLREYGVVPSPGLIVGKAGDRIALAIANGFNPDLCAD